MASLETDAVVTQIGIAYRSHKFSRFVLEVLAEHVAAYVDP